MARPARFGTSPTIALAIAALFAGCDGLILDAASTDRPAAPGDPTAEDPGEGGPATALPAEACDVTTLGEAPLRRLTRVEYDNTVQDLLGVTETPSDLLTDDETVGPFASNQGPVSVLHLDQFASAAERLAVAVDSAALSGCDEGGGDRDACMARFIRDFGARAFRAPLADAQVDAFLALQAGETSVEAGVQIVISAMLQSPRFLYHVELPPAAEGVAALDGYAVASRLSYFLWRSMPDESLFAAAEAGELATTDGVEAHARRLLEDPKAQAMVRTFYTELLTLQGFEQLEKDYPEFTPEARDAMLTDTMELVDFLYWESPADFATLLTTPIAFVDGERVELDRAERAGILTHPSVLSALGKAAQSAPVHRGHLVREHFLCDELPDPPPGIMVDDPPADPSVPRREQFREHSENAACVGCHSMLDPVGFAFEHYDGMGRYRAEDGGEPVDASGRIVGSADLDGDGAGDIDGDFYGAVELARIVAESEQARRCATIQWFRYATGRLETTRDRCALRAIVDRFEESGFDLRELLVALATSEALRSIDVAAESDEEVAP